MRRRRNEYAWKINIPGRVPRRRNAGGRRTARGSSRKAVRNLIIGFPAALLAAGLVVLIVYGCVHLRDNAFENDEKLSPAYADQQGQEDKPGVKAGPEGNSSNENFSPEDNQVNLVGTNRTPEPGGYPPAVTQSPAPASALPPVPASPSPEPTSNGHELDDEIVIVIDAGHGGYDGGSVVGNVVEKDVNLAVAQEIARLLEEHGGITVVQTRASDIHVGLQERSDIANEAKCDYFVSVHCNTYKDDSSVRGFECHYNEKSSEGASFAQGVTDNMKQYNDMKIRSVKPNNLAVTVHTYCPAILIEMGFLTNSTDCANLSDPDWQKQLAQRITDAVLKAAGL